MGSNRMTVCNAPESTNAKNSVLPDRTLTVGQDLHVGSLLTLLICPANRRRARWLGSRRRALLSGWSTAPRQNLTSWTVGNRRNALTRLPHLLLPGRVAMTAAAIAVEVVTGRSAPVLPAVAIPPVP